MLFFYYLIVLLKKKFVCIWTHINVYLSITHWTNNYVFLLPNQSQLVILGFLLGSFEMVIKIT